MRRFKFGWYGDNNLGERLILQILGGEKTATVCPAYDPVDADVVVGEQMLLVDKHDNPRGVLEVTLVENRALADLGQDLAEKIGATLEDLQKSLSFANGRELKTSEELRVTHFILLSDKPPVHTRK